MGKKRSNVIKFLISCIPEFLWKLMLPETPRMYISSNLIQDICGFPQNLPTDDSNSSFCNFKPNFQNQPLQQMYNSTPRKDFGIENDKLKAVQQQLDEIKELVAKLVDMQTDQCSDYGTLTCPDQLQKSFVPPPPPPLPENFSLLPENKLLPTKKHDVSNKSQNKYGFPSGKELLQDLQKVKLKKVEKSPGGGPVKKSQITSSDPGHFLAAALKRRFGRLHDSQDSSVESMAVSSTESENSYISGTLSHNYKLGKNI